MILLDVHPAEFLDAAGERVAPVRAVLTDQRLRVWRAVGREVELVVDEPVGRVVLESRHPRIGQPIDVPLTAGGSVQLVRAKGCGCGSPLRAIRPPQKDT